MPYPTAIGNRIGIMMINAENMSRIIPSTSRNTLSTSRKVSLPANVFVMLTPLMVVLVVIEFSDVIFAVDSIPAIFAVTRDPFVVFTSNVFAILGLRSMYFALSSVMHKFHYLKYGLAVILTFVGVKMLLGHTSWKIPIGISLAVVALVLLSSVIASLLWPPKGNVGDDSTIEK